MGNGMTLMDEAIVARAGIEPTSNNVVVSMSQEMAEKYMNNPSSKPAPDFKVQLTPLQIELLKQADDRDRERAKARVKNDPPVSD